MNEKAEKTPWTLNHSPYVRKEQKVGRNEICPCGSNIKYKKCCGK